VWPYNFCIGEVQCALGTALLKRVDLLGEKRRRRAKKFIDAVKDYPELVFQTIPSHNTTTRHLLPAKYDSYELGKTNHDFIEIMYKKYNVKMAVQYYPLYRYPMFIKAGFREADCPNTDHFFDNMVSFPFHSWMSEEQFNYMIESTIKTLNELKSYPS
jgi:dTDP-4-amino-4,6-dideoxygalactose transaminase